MRIQYFAIISSHKAPSILTIKEGTGCTEKVRMVVVAGHMMGPNKAGMRRSWIESEESAQSCRGKRNERGETEMAKPRGVCTLLGS